MKKSAVIVETRSNPDIIQVIQDHMKHLDNSWSLTIFSGFDNYEMMKAHFPEAKIVNLQMSDMKIDDMRASQYNRILTSKWFWNQIDADKVLIFQHDSMLLRNGIDEFMKYDYIGAAWTWQQFGGNGGLSLRSKKAMLDVITLVPYNESEHGNEDGYFCNHMQLFGAVIAPRQVCQKFSVEAVFSLGSMGFHAIDKWLSKEQCKLIKEQYK